MEKQNLLAKNVNWSIRDNTHSYILQLHSFVITCLFGIIYIIFVFHKAAHVDAVAIV